MKEKIRFLLTKSRLDAHDRAVLTVASALKEAGMEVIFIEFGTPEDLVMSAIQEDVDMIGIGFAAGGCVRVTEEVIRLLKKRGIDNLPIIVGGTIHPNDAVKLKEIGVREVFPGGSSFSQITNFIRFCVPGTRYS